MQRLAGIAAAFTPQVSIEPPDGLLLEIKPSITLFGGLRQLCRQLRAACLADAVLAQTRPAAAFHARAHGAGRARRRRAPARVASSPIRTCCPRGSSHCRSRRCAGPRKKTRRLGAWACARSASSCACRAPGSPNVSAPRRLADLDRLLGRRADPRRRLTRRERYRGRVDLDHEIEDHERILRGLAPCSTSSSNSCATRQRGITALQCRFHHYRAAPTSCVLRLAAPGSECRSGCRRCCASGSPILSLPEPVRRCELRGGALSERPLASQPLWSPGEHGHAPAGEMPALIEHLRARLGAQAVYGLRLRVRTPSRERLARGGAGARRRNTVSAASATRARRAVSPAAVAASRSRSSSNRNAAGRACAARSSC